MESSIEVALAVKLRKLFPPSEGKFLSFPLGMGFKYDELDFMKDTASLSAEQLRQSNLFKAQFARTLNVVPQDQVVFAADAGRFLWDDYRSALTRANLAESILTDNEKSQLQEAEAFLTDQIDGIKVNSKAVNAYYEYKELHDEAERIYLDEEITVDNSDDASLKEKWDGYREKELRDIKERAYSEWVNLGYKKDIERYQQLAYRLGQRDPYLYTQSYLEDMNASVETLDFNDSDGTYSTFYSPLNCFEKSQSWSKVTMRRPEITSLIRSAPPELKKFVSRGPLGIESISLEYKKVVILRPWFKPDFLSARYWKLPDSSVVISDGKTPRQGKIPAFITGMIVTRNVEVKRRKGDDSPPPIDLGFLSKHLKFMRKNMIQVPIIAKPKITPTINLPRRSVSTRATISSSPPNKFVKAKYVGTSVATPPVRVPKRTTEANQTEELVSETLQLDGVAIIGFVCRRIAKSPNPDTDLRWVE